MWLIVYIFEWFLRGKGFERLFTVYSNTIVFSMSSSKMTFNQSVICIPKIRISLNCERRHYKTNLYIYAKFIYFLHNLALVFLFECYSNSGSNAFK